jgi:glycosyltransferase involved in cell wall biosynthesis
MRSTDSSNELIANNAGSLVDTIQAPEPAPRVSVVSPFYNEAPIIVACVRRMIGNLRRHLGTSWELVLVNDGSSDGSLERLLGALQEEEQTNIRVVSYPLNQGRGRALKIGIDNAQGEIIVTTEIDGSWGDDIVSRLVAEMDKQLQLHFVIASPHRPSGGLVNVPINRVLLSRFGNQLIKLFFESQISMNTGMTRAYRREVIQPLVTHENGKEFHLEVLLKLLTLGFRAGEIPAVITWPTGGDRTRQDKRTSSTRIARTIKSHLRFIAIAQPVRYFAWLAFFSLLLGSVFMTLAVWALISHKVPAAFLALVGLNMLLFSLLFTGFSVLFYQVRESMREAWLRPYVEPSPSSRTGITIYPRPLIDRR